MISIGHKIKLKPNKKMKTHFRKAFGCARLAYNWGVEQCEKRGLFYLKKPSDSEIVKICHLLRAEFNAIKEKEYPYVYKVAKSAVERPFDQLAVAMKRYYHGLAEKPTFKRKKYTEGSYYIDNTHITILDNNINSKVFLTLHKGKTKRQYLSIPNSGKKKNKPFCVKMAERIRFDTNGRKPENVTISQKGDTFYASFSLKITEEEYFRTHPALSRIHKEDSVGIDLGVSHAMVLSNGITIENPRPLKKRLERIKRISRKLDRREHPRTKEERRAKKKASKNYVKLANRLSKQYRKVADIRNDFAHKVTTILASHFAKIGMEDLNVKEMVVRKKVKVYKPDGKETDSDGRKFDYHKKKKKLALPILDVSFYKIRALLEYKAALTGTTVVFADQKVQRSSQTCSNCGHIDPRMKNLWRRVYECENCGAVLDRDFNAAINLLGLVRESKVGVGDPNLKPVDLTLLLDRIRRNGVSLLNQESNINRS